MYCNLFYRREIVWFIKRVLAGIATSIRFTRWFCKSLAAWIVCYYGANATFPTNWKNGQMDRIHQWAPSRVRSRNRGSCIKPDAKHLCVTSGHPICPFLWLLKSHVVFAKVARNVWNKLRNLPEWIVTQQYDLLRALSKFINVLSLLAYGCVRDVAKPARSHAIHYLRGKTCCDPCSTKRNWWYMAFAKWFRCVKRVLLPAQLRPMLVYNLFIYFCVEMLLSILFIWTYIAICYIKTNLMIN